MAGKAKPAATWEPIGSLRPDPKNHRRHPESQVRSIAASIEKYGWGRPILARLDGTILAGHGTWLAAKLLEMETVLVRRMDLTPAMARELGLLDNLLPDQSEDDQSLVEEVLASADADFRALLAEDLSLVEEVELTDVLDVTGEVPEPDKTYGGKFVLVVRGPLTSQEEALRKLGDELRGLDGVSVEATWT